MAKVNEFETAHYTYGSNGKQRFSSEANMQYTYSSADDLLNNLDDLSKMIQHHMQHQLPRLRTLENYYLGNNETILINKRRREEHLADNRATHNFAKYVSQFIQGYMVGVPLKTSYPDDAVNDRMRDLNRENDADEHNSDMVLDLSIYGRAYELLYRNNQHQTRFTKLDVKQTCVVYDDTVEMNPIVAIRYFGKRFGEDLIKVNLYTDNKMYTYTLDNAYKLTLSDESEHFFDGVPIVEYQNNKFRQGDYEDVLSLIDLYDSAQSDIANYMSDINDAMLVIIGDLDIDVEAAKKQKEANLLMLQTEMNAEGRSSQASANYIYKKYDVAGTEAYKNRLLDNLLLFTNVPNLLDNKFAGNQSGEALKMKLFGLEQKRATKERLFKKSLRDRYRLINNLSKTAAEGEFDVNDITIKFTANLPSAIDQELQWFASLGGELSQETLLSLLSFVDNPQEELEKIADERPQGMPYEFEG